MNKHHSAALGLFAVLCLLPGCGGGTPDSQHQSPPPPPPPSSFIALHTFGGPDGARPEGLIRDQAGNLYGTTLEGGNLDCRDDSNGCGTIFKITPDGTFSTLHTFTGAPSDGGVPRRGLVLGSDGNLYGGTFSGGPSGLGVLFKLSPRGDMTFIYESKGAVDRCPVPAFQDSFGNIYGTTGINDQLIKCSRDCGTVFKLDPAGNINTLHTFNGADGDSPSGDLLMDDAGTLYGTTDYGGVEPACVHPLGCGTVFKIDTNGVFTSLHSFIGTVTEGEVPFGSLARDGAGNLYGTTVGGGEQLGGTIYRIDANGTITTLHSFIGDFDGTGTDPGGAYPEGGVLLGQDGNLYGTTYSGGAPAWGILFEFNPQSGEEVVLHTFSQAEGGASSGPLVAGDGGSLYGTGLVGGDVNCQPPTGCGIVFKFSPP